MGMKAMETRMSATANNLANVNTDGFKKDRVTLGENQNGGVSATVSKVNTPGSTVEAQGTTRELSNVDLAEEITDTMTTRAGYSANLKVLQSQDELLGTLLDIKK
jgi:flagellar basal-body rod protein FlgC